ncbi:MAG: para-aminobenzoate synthetase / 4-amino-4-deoxychorismate lyase [Acidobacteriota bacterium]|jgi:para-aminobenzoate synthetase/4-amino-4-deoxychorismate lyase|nr:para-aminobenzoate synthetase / 4-amino-4-deoxychorismate lyase [Acidobacteriota bacterium]
MDGAGELPPAPIRERIAGLGRKPADLARFDALGPHGEGRSFVFQGLESVVEAWALADVLPALQGVEAAVALGLHAAGFLAYEAAPAFDSALVVREPDGTLPLLRFAIFRERTLGCPPSVEEAEGEFSLGAWSPSVSEQRYAEAIHRIREWIAAGDTYQVNHTFRLRAPFTGDIGGEAALYARLVLAQRAAYSAHLRCDDFSILSISPELFFRWVGDALTLRPMKGTRPRGRWPAEDDALAAELLESAKDRAENVMIVDLLRSDAGRVALPGSVEVPRLFEVERYETVHQMTSTVEARTRPGTRLSDLFRALFPSGSITGAPKVRTSHLIAELEDSPRGVYTGAVGFVSPGEAVWNVAIRTLVIDRRTGTAELGVGSGITYDSDAKAEYRECLAKAEFARRAPNDFHLLETLLWEPDGGLFLLGPHLDRLGESARYFGFPFDREEIARRLAEGVSPGATPLRVRLLLARDGGVSVEVSPLPVSEEPVRVALAGEPVDSREPLLYHKTTRREVYERRAAERPDCGDVLLVNERGEVTESTIANLVVEIGGERLTPPLACGLLPGVFRAELLRRGEIRERVLTPADLRRAEAIWLVSSVRRWRRAVLAD